MGIYVYIFNTEKTGQYILVKEELEKCGIDKPFLKPVDKSGKRWRYEHEDELKSEILSYFTCKNKGMTGYTRYTKSTLLCMKPPLP